MSPLINPTDIDHLRASVDFHALVSGVTELRPAGRPDEYLGLCPFHEERRPSLSVNSARGIYNCFSCGAGGDVIDFVRGVRGGSFRDAVAFLSDYTGEDLDCPDRPRRKLVRAPEPVMTYDARLLDLLDRASRVYEHLLSSSAEGAPAREYLEQRGVPLEIAARFRLGFAPAGGRTICPRAQCKGFSAPELRAAGLAARSGEELVDHFKSRRLMFPISDAKGNVRGFAGRTLDGGDPKYFNSANSSIFIKGQTLFGFAQAREAINAAGRVIVVEGYMDALALAANNLSEAVSVMGIALTKRQALIIAGLGVPVVITYDGDAGGASTVAEAAARLAAAGAKDVRVAQLPAGEDPASLLAGGRKDDLLAAIAAAKTQGRGEEA